MENNQRNMLEMSDYQHIQKFKVKYGRKYYLIPDLTEDGGITCWNIETLFKPRRFRVNGEEPFCVWEYSATHLCALIPRRAAANILARHPCVKQDVDTDEGTVILFPAEYLDNLAADLKLRRRRKLSAEHKEKLVKAGAKHRFKTYRHGSNEQINGLKSTEQS